MEISQELARNPGDNISHIGHLGGMFIGFIYLKYGNQISKYFSFIKIRKVSQNKNTTNLDIDDVDRILDKLKTDGWDGLSEHEKSTLFQASKKRRQDNHLN